MPPRRVLRSTAELRDEVSNLPHQLQRARGQLSQVESQRLALCAEVAELEGRVDQVRCVLQAAEVVRESLNREHAQNSELAAEVASAQDEYTEALRSAQQVLSAEAAESMLAEAAAAEAELRALPADGGAEPAGRPGEAGQLVREAECAFFSAAGRDWRSHPRTDHEVLAAQQMSLSEVLQEWDRLAAG
eukprot:TRINITY_DN48152_c0_g1_i1.p2 TRINITY_DN48152_c0_g1~~TRINITY_DN48152_c0_g1_i1.p2  ORF type:complete len:189 (+),score=53.05 TRINITY_DN48152_c0_g1_i1:77-643(+)